MFNNYLEHQIDIPTIQRRIADQWSRYCLGFSAISCLQRAFHLARLSIDMEIRFGSQFASFAYYKSSYSYSYDSPSEEGLTRNLLNK